jgi:hypothetical protein
MEKAKKKKICDDEKGNLMSRFVLHEIRAHNTECLGWQMTEEKTHKEDTFVP